MSVLVDDFIVCKNSNPAFTTGHGNELWVILVEKAWAKIHGSYERIAWGQAHETMRDLCGAPAYGYNIAYEEEKNGMDFAKKLVEWDGKNYMMAAGVPEATGDLVEKHKELGLVAQHSYSIIAANLVTDSDGNEITLC